MWIKLHNALVPCMPPSLVRNGAQIGLYHNMVQGGSSHNLFWERCHFLLLEVSSEMSACDTLGNIGSHCSITIYDPETIRSDVVHWIQ